MKRFVTVLTGFLAVLLVSTGGAFAQEAGDYRSAEDGDWGDVATWHSFDGNAWVDAAASPDGSENIEITHTVSVSGSLSVTGYVTVHDDGQLTVAEGGDLTFADGSHYEHARDAGSVPLATWEDGSTFLLTGTVQDAPGNRNQSFHHVVFNTTDLGRNRDMGWNDVTIGGDVHVLSTGANRWQMSSVSAADTARFTIMGDVIVEDGQFAVQGTGNALTLFEVHHYGDLTVTGGNFSLARGSQGNGSGSTVWHVHEGSVAFSDATTQNSNPAPSGARFVFAADGAQALSFEDINFAGGQFHFDVEETATLSTSDGLEVSGYVRNYGAIDPAGSLTFLNNSTYDHARNGGSVPSATWAEGSTALFSGITTDAPGNRGQDYHHLVLNTPDLTSNRDLSLDGNTISGDIHVVSTGNARWQLVGGSSGMVTIMGDVIMEAGQFTSQGTGSATDVVIAHYGDINVTGGNFAISRGSQGGVGTTRWYLHEGDFSLVNATTQNSNSAGATFVFAADGEQNLYLEEVTYAGGGLPITVADGATLHITGDPVGGNAAFTVEDGAALATTDPAGFGQSIQTSGNIVFAPGAGFTFSGTEAQQLGMLPDSVGVLTIANAEGVTVADTLHTNELRVLEDALLVIAEEGDLSVGGGEVAGTIYSEGSIHGEALTFLGTALYEHARNAGSVPSGDWQQGSTALFSGVTANAPGNRNQSYHHVIFDTPELLSNLNMGFDDVTIGGDITVRSTGSARWYLTSASAGDSTQFSILGDVYVEDGQFAVHGTGNAMTGFIVDHYGDIVVTGGNFSIGRGSQGNTGMTRWNLHSGNFSMAGATSQNSNVGNARFVFMHDGTQSLELGEGNTINHLPIEVAEGTTLDLGSSAIGGNDVFILNERAYLASAHEDGVAGAVATSGDVSLSEGAGFIFNGTDPQVTSTLMPTTVHDLWIDNPAGVILSQETRIEGTLRLMAGVFDDTIPFRIGDNGTISFEGGSVVVSNEDEVGIPTAFELHQNYPNPFNPSTTIQYDVRESVHVRVAVYDVTGRLVTELVNGVTPAGTHRVEWNANGLASGVYLYRIDAGSFSAVRTLTLLK
jgi:hypothetical protein